jgi:hypothetical protein
MEILRLKTGTFTRAEEGKTVKYKPGDIVLFGGDYPKLNRVLRNMFSRVSNDEPDVAGTDANAGAPEGDSTPVTKTDTGTDTEAEADTEADPAPDEPESGKPGGNKRKKTKSGKGGTSK